MRNHYISCCFKSLEVRSCVSCQHVLCFCLDHLCSLSHSPRWERLVQNILFAVRSYSCDCDPVLFLNHYFKCWGLILNKDGEKYLLKTDLCVCLNWISLSDYNRLVRLKEGASFTISCNPTEKQESLNLLGRLDKDETQVLHLDLKTRTSKSRLEDRLKYTENGDPYKLLITISNLTVEDTKVYRCEYSRFDPAAGNVLKTEGKESVLLVVDGTCPVEGVFYYFIVKVNL